MTSNDFRPLSAPRMTWLTVFAASMGLLEAIVALYLRELYYPQGFTFPMKPIPPAILSIEMVREFATIIMLVAVSMMAGRSRIQRLSSFLYAFGVWDIAYYLGLKLFLDWPPSLMTWGVLFLIPVVWVGPVLSPVICACTMILIASCAVGLESRGYLTRITAMEWLLYCLGSFVIFAAYVWDFTMLIIEGGFLSQFWGPAGNREFQRIVSQYRPEAYHWGLFAVGEGMILCALVLMVLRARRSRQDLLH